MGEDERRRLFRKWLEERRGIVYKVIRAFAADREDQRDLFQEIALQLWRSTAVFRSGGGESTWVYKVALNTAMVYHRINNRHRVASIDDNEGLEPSAIPDDPTALEKREMLERVYSEIRRLPEADRSIVLLNLDGFSNGEIADMVGISPGYVAVRLTRARKRLSEFTRRTTDGA